MGRGLLTCVIKFCKAATARQCVLLLLSLTSRGRKGGVGGGGGEKKDFLSLSAILMSLYEHQLILHVYVQCVHARAPLHMYA